MSIPLTINGTDYDYPEQGDVSWGPDATDWAVAVTNGMLQKAGGTFQLLAEVDFGTSYGLKSLYYKSRTSNPASAGQIRLARTDVISFRNQANAANLDLGVNSSNELTFDGVVVSGAVQTIGTIDSETKSANGAVIDGVDLVLQTADETYPGLVSISDQAMSGHKQFTDGVTAGDPGTEGSGINISGVTFNSTFKVSDIDGTNFAQTILHRHSTLLEPLIVGARSNSNTSAHADVTGGQGLFTIYGVGYAGSNYKLFGSITLAASSSGSISNTSSPGKIVLSVTADSATSPSAALTIEQDKSATFAGDVVVAGDLTVNGTTTYINTTNMDVTDKSIKVNFGGNDASSEGAGIEVVRTTTNGSIIYAAAAASKWKIGNSGAEVEVADISTAQTLTNKTINGSNNTLSNIPVASLATLTASRAVQTSAGGVLEVATTTSTELGYVSGVTSSIQTQLNNKQDLITVVTPGAYPYTALNSTIILVDTSAARSIQLPAPSANFMVTIKDAVGSANTNNITVLRNGSEQIEGVAASRVLSANWGSWTFVSNGTNWFMI